MNDLDGREDEKEKNTWIIRGLVQQGSLAKAMHKLHFESVMIGNGKR